MRAIPASLPSAVEVHYDRAVSGFSEDDEGVCVRFKHVTNEVRASSRLAPWDLASSPQDLTTVGPAHDNLSCSESWPAFLWV